MTHDTPFEAREGVSMPQPQLPLSKMPPALARLFTRIRRSLCTHEHVYLHALTGLVACISRSYTHPQLASLDELLLIIVACNKVVKLLQ